MDAFAAVAVLGPILILYAWLVAARVYLVRAASMAVLSKGLPFRCPPRARPQARPLATTMISPTPARRSAGAARR
jgi:hypothetical protein